MFKRAVLGSAALALIALRPVAAETFHLIKSLSGPSGKSVGAKIVLDETRSRFIYPQDKALIVYFEWQAPIGNHTLGSFLERAGRARTIHFTRRKSRNQNSLPERLLGIHNHA